MRAGTRRLRRFPPSARVAERTVLQGSATHSSTPPAGLDELSRHMRVKEAAVEAGELKAAAAAAARLRGTVAELTPIA